MATLSFQGSYLFRLSLIASPNLVDGAGQKEISSKSFMLNEPCCFLSIFRDMIFSPPVSALYTPERADGKKSRCLRHPSNLPLFSAPSLTRLWAHTHTKTVRVLLLSARLGNSCCYTVLGSALASLPLVMGESSSIRSISPYIFFYLFIPFCLLAA